MDHRPSRRRRRLCGSNPVAVGPAQAAKGYCCTTRASLLRTNRAADSKPRRFGAEQGMCVPMLAAEANRGRLRLSNGAPSNGRGSGGIAAALRQMEERCERRSCAGRRLVFVLSRRVVAVMRDACLSLRSGSAPDLCRARGRTERPHQSRSGVAVGANGIAAFPRGLRGGAVGREQAGAFSQCGSRGDGSAMARAGHARA